MDFSPVGETLIREVLDGKRRKGRKLKLMPKAIKKLPLAWHPKPTLALKEVIHFMNATEVVDGHARDSQVALSCLGLGVKVHVVLPGEEHRTWYLGKLDDQTMRLMVNKENKHPHAGGGGGATFIEQLFGKLPDPHADAASDNDDVSFGSGSSSSGQG